LNKSQRQAGKEQGGNSEGNVAREAGKRPVRAGRSLPEQEKQWRQGADPEQDATEVQEDRRPCQPLGLGRAGMAAERQRQSRQRARKDAYGGGKAAGWHGQG